MSQFFRGVIEGFYGRQWSWQDRVGYASFLAENGYDYYIYAPKADYFLRSQWRELHSSELWLELNNTVSAYHDKGVKFGLGFSPLGLNESYTASDRIALKKKIAHLNELNLDCLCILFDDVKSDIDCLARRQISIVNEIVDLSNARHFIVCPSYYSFDPVLEEVFGKKPARYLEDLGEGLSEEIDLFWTGNKVISLEYSIDDIKRISAIIRRKPVLWDNYPVNDGRLTSNFLHLKPYSGRPWQLQNYTSGHVVNPMNQPELSKIVLKSLDSLYREKDHYNQSKELIKNVRSLGVENLASQLLADVTLFQYTGLAKIPESDRNKMREIYRMFKHPVGNEIADWLAGRYEFDPDCLTD